jgi:hypothetical protein
VLHPPYFKRLSNKQHREYVAGANAKQRAKHPCQHQPTRFVASWWELLAKQDEEFQVWHDSRRENLERCARCTSACLAAAASGWLTG